MVFLLNQWSSAMNKLLWGVRCTTKKAQSQGSKLGHHRLTAALSSLQCHCYNVIQHKSYSVIVTLPVLSYCYSARVTLLLLHCQSYFLIVTVPELLCYCYIARVTLLEWLHQSTLVLVIFTNIIITIITVIVASLLSSSVDRGDCVCAC